MSGTPSEQENNFPSQHETAIRPMADYKKNSGRKNYDNGKPNPEPSQTKEVRTPVQIMALT